MSRVYGIDNGQAKLTAEAVSAMRREYRPRSQKYGAAALARRYGVTYYAAWCAIHRQTWPHVRDAA